MTFGLFLTFVLMSSVCCLNVIPLSNVTTRILVLCVTGRGVFVKCYLWLCYAFSVVRCNECERGFVCGELYSVVGEPLF